MRNSSNIWILYSTGIGRGVLQQHAKHDKTTLNKFGLLANKHQNIDKQLNVAEELSISGEINYRFEQKTFCKCCSSDVRMHHVWKACSYHIVERSVWALYIQYILRSYACIRTADRFLRPTFPYVEQTYMIPSTGVWTNCVFSVRREELCVCGQLYRRWNIHACSIDTTIHISFQWVARILLMQYQNLHFMQM